MVAVIPTIAALRLYLGIEPVVFVTGYYGICDGGEGPFVYNAADSTSADNGGTIIVDSLGRRWYRSTQGRAYSAKQFGAKGDGTTDDTSALQACDTAACAAHVGMELPPGIYRAGSSIINGGGTTWTGAGKNLSVLKALALTYPNNSGLLSVSGHSGFDISGIGFDISAGTYPPGVGIPGNVYWTVQIAACTKWSLTDCEFDGIQAHTIGIDVEMSSDFKISDNHFNMPTPSSSYNQAINISAPCAQYEASNNVMLGTGLQSNGSYGRHSDNYVSGVQFGAGLGWGPLSSCINHIAIGNMCLNAVGLDVDGDYCPGIENWAPNTILLGNLCAANSGDGITNGALNVLTISNICINNGQSPAAAGDGIREYSINSPMSSTAAEGIVLGNICGDQQTPHTQAHGYAEYVVGGSPISNMTVVENNFNHNLTATMSVSGSSMSFRGPSIPVTAGPVTPGVIASGSSFIYAITAGDANLGDIVHASFNIDLRGVTLTAYVQATNVVLAVFANATGTSVTLGAGNVTLAFDKPVAYPSM